MMDKQGTGIREWTNGMLRKLPDKPIAEAYKWYTDRVKSPLVDTALKSGAAYGLGTLLKSPITETLRSLFRKPGTALLNMNGSEDPEADYDEAMDELKRTRYLPAIASMLTAFGGLYSNFDPKTPGYGLLTYNSHFQRPVELRKRGAFENTAYSYFNDIDWHKQINTGVANSLFTNDSHFDDNPYARQMGVSIVNNAAITNHTNEPTVGNIFDSAVQKIDTKLTVGGLVQAGTRALVANGAARLFTSALDMMCDLNPKTRQTIVDAGTWAGAISTLFD